MSASIGAPQTENGHTTIEITTSGCLFDLDGTLMLSSDSVEAAWRDLGKEKGIDAEELLKTSHGRRSIDTLKVFCPEMANLKDCGEFEATIPRKYKHLATPVPGVHEFLTSLPASQWGIVTSGTYPFASQWMEDFLQIPMPPVFITAESIAEGKPHPEGYLTGHKLLNLLQHFLVFEDAPAGIQAGKRAGATVIGMATTYDAKRVKESGADIIIPSLEHIKFKSWDPETKELKLVITDPLDPAV